MAAAPGVPAFGEGLFVAGLLAFLAPVVLVHFCEVSLFILV